MDWNDIHLRPFSGCGQMTAAIQIAHDQCLPVSMQAVRKHACKNIGGEGKRHVICKRLHHFHRVQRHTCRCIGHHLQALQQSHRLGCRSTRSWNRHATETRIQGLVKMSASLPGEARTRQASTYLAGLPSGGCSSSFRRYMKVSLLPTFSQRACARAVSSITSASRWRACSIWPICKNMPALCICSSNLFSSI